VQIGSYAQNHIVEKGHKTTGVKVTKVFAGRHNQPVIIGLWSQQTCFRKKLPEFEQAHYDPKPTSYCCWQQNI